MTTEIWKATHVSGYEVSSLGRVRSLSRVIENEKGVKRLWRGRILKHGLAGRGYRFVMLGSKHPAQIHVLVCRAFHGPKPSARHEVAHFDGDSLNNRAENLRWATRKENSADTARHGKQPRGSDHGRSKLDHMERQRISRLAASGTVPPQKIADEVGLNVNSIYRLRRNFLQNGVPQ